MATDGFSIDLGFNPVLNVDKLNVILNHVKTAMGSLGSDIKMIDGNKLAADMKKFDTELVQAGKHTDNLKKGFKETETTLSKLKSSIGQGLSIAIGMSGLDIVKNGLTSVVKSGMDYQKSLADMSALTGVTGGALTNLGNKARGLSKDFGGTAVAQINSMKGVLSRFGPDVAKTPQALAEITRSINILGEASGMDAATSMDALTNSMLQFGVDVTNPAQLAKESARFINTLGASAKFGAAEIPQVTEAIVNAGVACTQANVSFETANAALQVLAAGGKLGAEAGIGLRNVLSKIGSVELMTPDAIKGLKAGGVNMQILTDKTVPLQTRLKELQKVQNDGSTISKLFGIENAASANILISGAKTIGDYTKQMTGTNTAYEQAKVNSATLAAQWERLKAKASDLAVGGFGVLKPVLSGVMNVMGAMAGNINLLLVPMGALGAAMIVYKANAIKAAATQLATNFSSMVAPVIRLGTAIISSLVPGLITQDVVTKKLIFNSNALTLANIRSGAADMAKAVATKVVAAATWLWTAATGSATASQWTLNAALAANPVGIIVLAVAALVGGLILLYKNNEGVRKAFDAAWKGIKAGFVAVWDVLKKVGAVIWEVGKFIFNWIIAPWKIAYTVIKNLIVGIVEFVSHLKIFQAIGKGVGNVFKTVFATIKYDIGLVGDAFKWVSDKLGNLKAVMVGVNAVFGSIMGTLAESMTKLFKLDFTGAKATLVAGFNNIGQVYNDAYNKEIKATQAKEDKKDAIQKKAAAQTAKTTKTTATDTAETASGSGKSSGSGDSKSAYEIALAQYEETNKLKDDANKLDAANKELADKRSGIIKSDLQLEQEKLDTAKKATEEIQRQITEFGNVKIKAKTADEQAGAEEILRKLGIELAQSEGVTADINLKIGKLNMDAEAELKKLGDELSRKKLEIAVKMGIKPEIDLINFDKNALQSQLDSVNAKMKSNSFNFILGTSFDPALQGDLLIKAADLQDKINDKNIELSDANEQVRLNGIKDSAKRERETRISEAKKALRQQLLDAKGNMNLEMSARNEYYQKLGDAEKAFSASQRVNILGLQVPLNQMALSFGASMNSAFANLSFSTGDSTKTTELKEQKNKLQLEEDALYESLRKREISQREYYDKLTQIQAEQASVADELAKQSAGIWKQVGSSMMGALQNMGIQGMNAGLEQYQTNSNIVMQLDQEIANNKVNSSITNDEMIARDTALQAQRATAALGANDAITQSYINMGITAAASLGELAINGKTSMKAVVMIALDMLQAMVPVWSAQMLAGSLATPQSIATAGGAGLLQFTLLSGLMMAAVGVAKAAVNKFFFKGGYTGNVGIHKEAGIVHGREFVFDNVMTSKNLPEFEKRHKEGLSAVDYVLKYEPETLRQFAEKRGDNSQEYKVMISQTQELIYENKQLRQELIKNTEEVQNLKATFRHNSAVNVTGSFEVEGDSFRANIEKAKQVSLARG